MVPEQLTCGRLGGVGDALGALNEYQLEPTAENYEKLKDYAKQEINKKNEYKK